MMNMISLALRRLSPHRITAPSRSWFCYFSVSAAKTPSEEALVAAFSSWHCIGSSHGWLGYVSPEDRSFYLFKPSLLKHPSYLPFISLPPLLDWTPLISKMIFSSSPAPIKRLARDNDSNNSSVLVVLTFTFATEAPAFCRMRDPQWTMLSNFPASLKIRRGKYLCFQGTSFQDIVYDSKHNLFYVITISGEIYSSDLSNYRYCSMKKFQDCTFQCLIKPPTTDFYPPPFRNDSPRLDEGIKYYLVMDESSRALLMIRLLIYYDYYNCEEDLIPGKKEYVFDVHSLDLDNKLELEWFKVEGLVDTALFIGRNNGVVVDARKVPGLVTPGYIYLACNAFGFFQLTALGFSYWLDPLSQSSISILRADMSRRDIAYMGMVSFPVWNFE